MIVRICLEKKIFSIECKSYTYWGHGYSCNEPGYTYIDEQDFESEEKCQKLLEKAKKHYRETDWKKEYGRRRPDAEPVLEFYWQHIGEEELRV